MEAAGGVSELEAGASSPLSLPCSLLQQSGVQGSSTVQTG